MHLSLVRVLTGLAPIGLAWLICGRRFVVPPPASGSVTFTSSRFVSAFFFLFCLAAAGLHASFVIITMFIEREAPFWERLAASWLVLLVGLLAAYGVWLFGVRTVYPDRLVLDEQGLCCRLGGRVRAWSWDQIRDIELRGIRGQMVILVLREPDPVRMRFLAHFPWKSDASRIPLGNRWRPAALVTSGEWSVYTAIRAALDRRDGRQPTTAQLSG